MLNHIGTQEIETTRLLLRRFCNDDVDSVFNNWAKDPDNVRYLTWKAHKSIDETYKIMNMWLDDYLADDVYNWCITLKDVNEVIGNINVVELWNSYETCEIGYVLSKKYWGNGIMTEALGATINYLFSKVGFNRIQAKHDVENPVSGRVMLKNSMQYEGTLRQYCKNNDGNWCDAAIYSILRSDFFHRI